MTFAEEAWRTDVKGCGPKSNLSSPQPTTPNCCERSSAWHPSAGRRTNVNYPPRYPGLHGEPTQEVHVGIESRKSKLPEIQHIFYNVLQARRMVRYDPSTTFVLQKMSFRRCYVLYRAVHRGKNDTIQPVSYTHLTLPTIYSV